MGRSLWHKGNNLQLKPMKSWGHAAFFVFVFIGEVYCSFQNYLLFHTIAELATIIVSFSIAVIVLNTHHIFENSFFLFLGVSYGFAGIFDFIHTLAYQGLGVIPNVTLNLAPQMWIIARYIDSIALLAASLFFARRIRPWLLLSLYSVVSLLLLLSVFLWGVFPDCFIEGVGLTPFKITSEYVICFVLLLSIIILIKNKNYFYSRVYYLLMGMYVTTICTELSFTFYSQMYGLSNMVGHLFKMVSYYLLYLAIVDTSLKEPYNLLFYKLKMVNKKLNKRNEQIHESNRLLQLEINERKQIETQLRHISFHDALTGLYNRAFFQDKMDKLSFSYSIPISIVVVDIDGLKIFNDTFGHEVGDKLIQMTANLLRQNVRDSDIVARVGGDEFVIIMPKTQLSVVKGITKCIEKAAADHNKQNQIPLIFLSIGCATSNSETVPELEEIFRQADSQMYKNKEQKRSAVRAEIANFIEQKKSW